MRIVLDLQACQGHGNRVRGIGRYSRLLAQSMLRESRGHEFWIVLNGGMPEAIDEIRGDFDGLLPQERIVLWDNPFPAAELHQVDPWPCRVAEVLREDFLASLRPDVIHVASLFEGWNDPSAASIGRGSMRRAPTAVTLYDLIPLAMREVYLKDGPTRRAYLGKLDRTRRSESLPECRRNLSSPSLRRRWGRSWQRRCSRWCSGGRNWERRQSQRGSGNWSKRSG